MNLHRFCSTFLAACTLVGLPHTLACTPTEDADPQVQRNSAHELATPLQPAAPASRWHEGQTWYVKYQNRVDMPIQMSFAHRDAHSRYFRSIWQYTVSGILPSGVVIVSIRSVGESHIWPEIVGELNFRGDDLIEANFAGGVIGDTFYHFVPPGGEPYFMSGNHIMGRTTPPWWPRFPLVPGSEQTFKDGRMKQTVHRDGEDLIVTISITHDRTDSPFKYWQSPSLRTMVMRWQDGAPWWSELSIEIAPSPYPGREYDTMGELVEWDGVYPVDLDALTDWGDADLNRAKSRPPPP